MKTSPLSWIIGMRGAFAIAFAIGAFVAPRATLNALAIVWGVYAFSDGIVATFAGAMTQSWSLLSVGGAMLVAGVCAFLQPDVTGRDLLPVLGVWALLRGAFDCLSTLTIARTAPHTRLLIANAVVSFCFGLLLLIDVPPDTVVAYVLASYALITGVILLEAGR